MNSHSQPHDIPASPPASSARWRRARKLVLALAIVLTVAASFFAVENWKGRRAWTACRHDLEAKGEKLDWTGYIPAPIPDGQNIFKAPKMQEWFVRNRLVTNSSKSLQIFTSLTNSPPRLDKPFVPVVLAELRLMSSHDSSNSEPGAAVLRLNDPAARGEMSRILREAFGRAAVGPAGYIFVAESLDQFKPAHLGIVVDTKPTVQEVGELIQSHFVVQPFGSNAFRVVLTPPVIAATDYLAWTEPEKEKFDLMRKALERPAARMDGSYEVPHEIPIVNFVNIRTVAQTLAQRAQCQMLLKRPAEALRELSLLHDLCRLLDARPVTLVAAMIKVAVTGLYTSALDDGLRLQVWQEPQLAALERQLAEINLIHDLSAAVKCERDGCCTTFETINGREFRKLFLQEGYSSWWEQIKSTRYWLTTWAPRGWAFQNMAAFAYSDQDLLETLDVTNQLAVPQRVEAVCHTASATLRRSSPYTWMADVAMPNYLKAVQTTVRNQTLANEARLACALERYRLARGQYPQSLSDLVPDFVGSVPSDIVTGQPLKYHLLSDSEFLLYSVGWNGRDDGGVAAKNIAEGDWVWQ